MRRTDVSANENRSLVALIGEADERGVSEAALIERVRASYDRDVPRRRVRRLIGIERERTEHEGGERRIESHPPRYADLTDLAVLTDAEFVRAITAVLRTDGDGEDRTLPSNVANVASDDSDEIERRRNEDAENESGGGESADAGRIDGVGENGEIRIRCEKGVLVRALAAEPGRVVDSEVVRWASEVAHGTRAHASAATGGESDPESTADDSSTAPAAIVTIADVTPGAARLAVRCGVRIYDRTDVSRWLDDARTTVGALASSIEE